MNYLFFIFALGTFGQGTLEVYKKNRDELINSSLTDSPSEFDKKAFNIYKKLNFVDGDSKVFGLKHLWGENKLILWPVKKNDHIEILIKDLSIKIKGVYNGSSFDQSMAIPASLKFHKSSTTYEGDRIIIKFIH